MGVDTAALLAKAQTGAYDSASPSETSGSSDSNTSATEQTSVDSTQAGTFGSQAGSSAASTGERTRGADGKFQAQSGNAPPVPGSKPAEGQQAKEKPKFVDEGDIDPENRETWKPSHRIDYERFRKVIGQRDAHARELASLKSKLAEMEQAYRANEYRAPQSGSRPAQSNAQKVIDDIWGPSEDENPWAQPLQQMQSRLDQYENERRIAEFDRESQAVLAKYPDIDEALFYQAVAAHIGDTAFDLEDVAEMLQAQLDGYATRRYGSRASAPASSTPVPSAPPRPAATGSSVPQRQTLSSGVDMSDPDQRQARLLELVKQRFG